MEAIQGLKKVIENCSLLLDGKIFSKEVLMKTFSDFLLTTTEKESHNVGYVLHTGSVCFDALALVYSAITCLCYSDARAWDVIFSLNEGDRVLYGDKKKTRYVFKGFAKFREAPGVKYIRLWKSDSESTCVPQSLWGRVTPYYGTSKVMDGRGLRTKYNIRELFYTNVLGFSRKKIPTVLNVSVVIVMPESIIRNLIEKLSIRFGKTEFKLTDLVTVSYFTENREIIIGGNVARTEANVKVTNKISVARKLILSRNGNKHIGLVVFGNEIISRNISELPELINRRSIQFVYLLMNMDYENALTMLRNSENRNVFRCSRRFLMSISSPIANRNSYTEEISCQIGAIINKDIEPFILEDYLTWSEYRSFKKAVFFIKNSDFVLEKKEDFIITACSLMNIFLTAIFKISDLEKCIADNYVSILSVEKRFEALRDALSEMPAYLKEKAEIIVTVLERAYLNSIDVSKKEEHLRKSLSENCDKKIAVVVPKSYYATVMRTCGFFKLMTDEKLLTVTTANRFDNSVAYDRIFVVGNIRGKRFDVFKCIASQRIETLLYECESNIFKYRARIAKKEEDELDAMNGAVFIEGNDETYSLYYSDDADENDVAEIDKIDNEIDEYLEHLKDIAIYRDIESSSASQGSGQTSEVVAVGTFDSGETIFFTKMYKAYVFDAGSGTVKEVGVRDLNEGDSLVFTKNSSETRDIVDTILGKLINERKFDDGMIECYRKSKRWKQSLRKYMLDNNLPAKVIAETMVKRGASVQEITILGWLDEDSHTVGPRHMESILQIANLVNDVDMAENAEIYYKSCATIRNIRREILSYIGRAIIDKLSGRKPAAGIMADIYERTGSVAQILRLERIVSIERKVPMNLTNHPINM